MISKRNILNLKSRHDVYHFISRNPGLHINEISKRTNMPRSTLRHHLRYLMKSNLINSKFDRNHRRFYTCELKGIKDKEILGLLRQKIPFKIIMYLLFPGFFSKTELAKELKLHPTTIDFHIKKLLEADIIRPVELKNGWFISSNKHKPFVFKKPNGREKFYTWKNSIMFADTYRILIIHKESMMDPDIIDTYNIFKEEWYHIFDKFKPKKFCSFDSTVDNYIKILEEIFPFPYNY